MAHIRFLDETGRLVCLDLDAEPCVIGRVATCQVVFPDDLISREHAKVERDADGRYRIHDLGSRNKTFVNGQMIGDTLLTSGDIVRVGNHVVEYVDDHPPGDELSLDFMTPDRSDPSGTEWVKIKSPISLTQEQLGQLATVVCSSAGAYRPEEVAEAALPLLLIELKADRGLIALKGEKKREIRPIAHRGLQKPPSGSFMPVSEGFIYSATLQAVAGRYPDQAGDINPKSGYAASGMVAPMVHRNRVVGLVYVDRSVTKTPYSAKELSYLMAAANQLAGAMAVASNRLADVGAVEGLGRLAVMRRTIDAMTTAIPEGDGVQAITRTTRGALRCGDLYDVFHLDEETTCIVLLDAGGQGMAGLAQAAGIRTAIRTSMVNADGISEMSRAMSVINDSLTGQKARQLVQCVIVGLDIRAGRAVYVNAGACPPLIMAGPARLVTLDRVSLLLGIEAGYVYEASTVDIPADYRLLCHSDGAVEAVNASGEPYGSERLHDLLLQPANFGAPNAIADAVMAGIQKHLAGQSCDDDVTLLIAGAK